AWIALFDELFNGRRSTSLSSMGIISFEYMRNDPGWSSDEISTPDLPAHLKRRYGLSIEEGRHLLELLILDACYMGAIDGGKSVTLNANEREYIFYTGYEKKLVKC